VGTSSGSYFCLFCSQNNFSAEGSPEPGFLQTKSFVPLATTPEFDLPPTFQGQLQSLNPLGFFVNLEQMHLSVDELEQAPKSLHLSIQYRSSRPLCEALATK
jgi:hypothetical protein